MNQSTASLGGVFELSKTSLWAKNPIAKPPMLFGHGISSSNHRSGDSKGSSYRHER